MTKKMIGSVPNSHWTSDKTQDAGENRGGPIRPSAEDRDLSSCCCSEKNNAALAKCCLSAELELSCRSLRNDNNITDNRIRKIFKFYCHGISEEIQESPRQTKPKKGPKRKVHEFRPIFVNSGVFS